MEIGASIFVVRGNYYGKKEEKGWVKVVKVGRKYFELENIRAKFTLDGWKEVTDYTAYYHLYQSEYEYKKSLRESRIVDYLRNYPALICKEDLFKIGDLLNIQ